MDDYSERARATKAPVKEGCPLCGGPEDCLSGSAHPDNWYCKDDTCGWRGWETTTARKERMGDKEMSAIPEISDLKKVSQQAAIAKAQVARAKVITAINNASKEAMTHVSISFETSAGLDIIRKELKDKGYEVSIAARVHEIILAVSW